MAIDITSIRIPSRYFSYGDNSYVQTTAEFKLGLGRCGETVTSLTARLTPSYVVVQQKTAEGSFKEFIYFTKDIIGRVEVARKEA